MTSPKENGNREKKWKVHVTVYTNSPSLSLGPCAWIAFQWDNLIKILRIDILTLPFFLSVFLQFSPTEVKELKGSCVLWLLVLSGLMISHCIQFWFSVLASFCLKRSFCDGRGAIFIYVHKVIIWYFFKSKLLYSKGLTHSSLICSYFLF